MASTRFANDHDGTTRQPAVNAGAIRKKFAQLASYSSYIPV